MTISSQFFSTYKPCSSNRKISVANGSLVTVAGLTNLLHVPNLAASLVSIQKITKDLRYHLNFYPSYFVFLGT